MCCCDACKCCTCTTVADSVIWAGILFHLNLLVSLLNVHYEALVPSAIGCLCFWIAIFGRKTNCARQFFYFIYLAGTVAMVGFLIYMSIQREIKHVKCFDDEMKDLEIAALTEVVGSKIPILSQVAKEKREELI